MRFDHKPDFALLEAVQNLGDGDRFHPLVGDRPDHAPLHHDKPHDHADFARLRFQSDVVKAAGVPQRHEVPAERFGIELVTFFGEDQGAHSVLGDAAGSTKLDFLHAAFQTYRFDFLYRFGRFERRLGSLPRLSGLGRLRGLRHRLERILILWRRRLRWGRRLLSYHGIGD